MTIDLAAAAYVVLAAIAVIYSALLTLQAYEFRRFCRSRCGQRDAKPPAGRVLLICPCRGAEPDLAKNLRPLFAQDHDNYRLLFVVDRLHDPACRWILRLMRAHPNIDAGLVVAGTATDCGQKVHNLLAATADVADDVRFLAFVDSDARPAVDWLRQLVQRLDQPGVVAATAYRWLVPRKAGLGNHLVHALDASVASLIGPGRHHLVWGGSWAVRRDTFEFAQLRAAWRGTLSDDLVAAQVLRSVGRVAFEPGAMVATTIDFDLAGMCEFVRRQFMIGRYYAPTFWALATLLACTQQAALWVGAAIAPVAWYFSAGLNSARWASWATLAAALIYGLQVLRGWLREDAARFFLPESYRQTAAARRSAVWLGPAVGLLHCWGLVRPLFSRRIEWRGITYELRAGGQIRSVSRSAATSGMPRRRKAKRRPARIRRP